ncbi:hypothetical protein Taro_015231 [Colocasia esculenta]|uniref:Uncharacterized protein n=1 Tax=Colocasia esculenta TaxID=4460 RepID=A0A843USK8_COLES|nr:hypothetical protein [Colocasia esculenta]
MEMGGMEWETSECSSGCDSGWTMYLAAGHSCEDAAAATPRRAGEGPRGEEDDDDDESLSMASDASSGPPHALDGSHDYNGRSYSASSPPSIGAAPRSNAGKRRRAEKQQLRMQEQASGYDCLDDTASSPFFIGLAKESFDLSNGDSCSRSGSSRASLEEAPEFSCGFSETHLKV